MTVTAPRREFPRKIKAEIVMRAMDADGRVICEGCGLVLGKKKYEIDHTVAEALVTDKSKALTKEDGRLLGLDCCHRPKSAIDVKVIAKTVRQQDKDRGIKNPPSFRKPPGSRYDWKLKRYVAAQDGGR